MFAVVFDFDGTILDSETAEFMSHKTFFADHGVQLTEDEWCTGVGIVQPRRHWFDWLCQRAAAPPSFDEFRAATRRYFRDGLLMEPMPGITALIGALVAAGIPRAVGSSASANWVMSALDDLRLTSSFATVVTGDQVARGKPAPDVYLEAARRLDVDPARCVAIEDSGPGLAAARAAGMKTVVIPHPLNRDRHDFTGADLSVESASALTLERLQTLIGTAVP